MKLMDFMIEEALIYDLRASDKIGVIKEMVEALKEAKKINAKDVDSVMKALIKREELGSTGIGKGVAVPHTKHPSIARLTGTVARSKKGVEFDALDGEPVHLFFLLLSPNEAAGTHLAALERISSVIRNSDFRRFMNDATGKLEMIEILREVDGL